MDRIDVKAIQAGLLAPLTIALYPELPSTNRLAKERLLKGGEVPNIIIADHQTAGYGQRERSFYSPAGTGIYMTFLWPRMVADESLGLLTPMLAVAVRRAIIEVCQVRPDIKWVNDLYLGQKKVVGILSESIPGHGVLAGVGINFKADETLDQVVGKAGALLPMETALTRNQLLIAVINQVVQMIPTFRTGNFLPEYRRHSLLVGREIRLRVGDDERDVTVSAIGPNAELVVMDKNGQEERYTSAEVTRILSWH